MQRPAMTVSQSKILVLYTGGTIGCLNTERGLTVQPGFLSVSTCIYLFGRNNMTMQKSNTDLLVLSLILTPMIL